MTYLCGMSGGKKEEIYFKNLDGLRFLAAFAVIIGHCQAILFKGHEEVGIRVYSPFADKLGSFGVDFFFVLSGFLISYLLMREIEDTQTVNIKHFYMRRFLRIWPLYFFVGISSIILGTTMSLFFGGWLGYPPDVQSTDQMLKNLLYLGTFSINFQTLLQQGNQFQVGHFWSLAVEEQFYLLWAPVFFIFRKRLLPMILVFIIIGLLLNLPPKTWFPQFYSFQYNFTANRFLQFGTGALLAWLLHRDFLTPQYPLSKMQSWGLQLVVLIPMLWHLLGSHYHPETYKDGYEQIENSIISVAIISAAITRYSVLHFEFGLLKYLGKISFGIYVFHIISVRIMAYLLTTYAHSPFMERNPIFHFLFVVGSTFLAVFLSALSYEFLEKPFLKLKRKFK
ncbi:MAG: acyltransferase [Saprospiraceae bacterium]|nr:acyltransferase [Saprospiraceae bacterium]